MVTNIENSSASERAIEHVRVNYIFGVVKPKTLPVFNRYNDLRHQFKASIDVN